MKVTDGTSTVAEFYYDALGRRVLKWTFEPEDCRAYFYNADWQVLDEYTWDGESLDFDRRYVYGNYIDEVLLTNDGSNDYYFVHDHLYSPAALLDYIGDVVERGAI